MQICINNSEIRAGSTVTGYISFAASSHRCPSEFQVTLALKGVLHTSIPTSNGLCEAQKSIYSRTTIVSTGYGHIRNGSIEVPFAYEIPSSCPASTTYSNVARLNYNFHANISDLATRICIPMAVSRKVSVLGPYQLARFDTISRRHKRITYTASPLLCPGQPYFIQLSYPTSTSIVDYKLTVLCSIRASHANATFTNKTESPLKNPTVITRKAFDNSTMTVLDVKIPSNLEHSVDIVGLSRQYKMHVYLVMQDQSIQTLEIDLEVIESGESTSGKSSEAELCMSAAGVRDLSMSDLATKALTLDLGYRSDASDRSASDSDSRATKHSIDELDSPPSSPKSSFSVLSSRASRSSGASTSPPISYISKLDRASLKIDSFPQTPSTQIVKEQTTYRRHVKNTSSMSLAELRPRMASITRFAKKLSFGQKTMEFSCCGPEDDSVERPISLITDQNMTSKRESRRRSVKAAAKRSSTPEQQIIGSKLMTIETSTSLLSSPSSTYSSSPRTPTSSTGSRSPTRAAIARKLSDSLNATLKMGKRGQSAPVLDERRFSISSYYLGGNDFTFQGISTLDIDGDACDGDEGASSLGFAV